MTARVPDERVREMIGSMERYLTDPRTPDAVLGGLQDRLTCLRRLLRWEGLGHEFHARLEDDGICFECGMKKESIIHEI